MKLLIAAATFAATLGMLFLIEAGKSPKEDYAQIVEALKKDGTSATASAAPSPTKARTLTPALTSAPVHIPAPTPSPAPQNSPTARQTPIPIPTQAPSPSPTPTPVQASAPQPTPTPTPTPSSIAIPTPTPATDHIFYTSHLACSRSKYIYCDTDKNWKNLVSPLSFATLDEALSACPNKTLHEPCK